MARYIPGKTCQQCGGLIPWRDGRSARENAKFCGNHCKLAYQSENPSRPRIERVTVPCAECGKPVTFLPSQRGSYKPGRTDNIYCDRKCKGAGHSKIMTGRRPSNGIYTSVSTFRWIARKAFYDRCSLCGWDEAPCDVAHIVSRKDGGTDDLENVTMLCPNHHRMYDCGLITQDQVRQNRFRVLR